MGICATSFLRISFQSFVKKNRQPKTKYFFSYKSNKVDIASFDHVTSLIFLLFCVVRLGRAMTIALANITSSIS